MKKLFIILLTYTICTSTYAATPQQANALNNSKHYQLELAKLLSSLNDVTGVPGFSVAVTHKGKLLASVGSGFSDVKNNDRVRPNTTFRLASVSKIIGATMLAELVTNGQLNPDLAIGYYYPELNQKYHDITVRQLLSHTSGMPHYQLKDFDIYDEHFDNAIDAVKTLKDRDLLSRPGSEYLYSTHGYTLAGALYEKITKQPLSAGINSFIKRWTGKVTPAIENIQQLNPSSSKLYELTASGAEELSIGEKSYSVFGAGLYASASDLALFGAKVLEKSKQQQSFKQLLFSPTKTQDGNLVTNRDFQVGFGWRIAKDLYNRTVYHHAGATPGARSILALYPEHDLSIAFLSNSSWISSIDKLVFALASLYIDEAQALSFENVKYQINHKDQQIIGQTDCQNNQCYIADDSTDYANWLNTFNSTSSPIKQWPVFTYTTKHGQRLLMVNKIGITTFEGKNNTFKGMTGKNLNYTIQLLSSP